MSTRFAFCTGLSALLLLMHWPQPAAADWPTNPTVNVALSVADGAQSEPSAAPDGGGGAIVAWHDRRGGGNDIYVRRVDGSGTARWTANGVALCTATGDQWNPEPVPDGSGGAIVTWSDDRTAGNRDIYVQRVDSSGTPLWTPNGVAVCAATGSQSHHKIIADGSGGAIITWDDSRTGNSRIYAQRVNASGVPQWTTNGVLLTNSLAGQDRPVIVSNGAGGAIVAWRDFRSGMAKIFAQRVLASGAIDPAWPAAGRGVALNWTNESYTLAVDGNGGALLGWARWYGFAHDIFVQHVLASGAIDPAWPANGRLMHPGVNDAYDQDRTAIVTDGAGGAIVSWDDNRADRNLYAQHVLASGALDSVWTSTGVALSLASGVQWFSRMVSDNAGGAIVTWQDLRADEGDIYAQRVLSTGTVDPAWPDSGRAISTAGNQQVLPTIIADGSGGAVIAWDDLRDSPGGFGDQDDIYVQHVKGDGQLGEVPVAVPDESSFDLALESPRPNPTRAGAMIMRFTLPRDAAASLELFDVAGRRIASRDVGSLGAGHHTVDLTGGRRPGAGVYFVRLVQGQGARIRRIVVLDE